jgi:cupin fold WbuC family metalloprotein
MNEVFYNHAEIATVDESWLNVLKDRARNSPLRRSRLCLHRAHDDFVQQMIIVMCRDVLFRPHRHHAKTESFHMIEGFLDLVFFDDQGAPNQAFRMGPPGSGELFCHRLSVSQFHAVLPLSDFVIVHEITTGPWVQGDAEFAPWAPVETKQLRVFLEDSAAKARLAVGKDADNSLVEARLSVEKLI